MCKHCARGGTGAAPSCQAPSRRSKERPLTSCSATVGALCCRLTTPSQVGRQPTGRLCTVGVGGGGAFVIVEVCVCCLCMCDEYVCAGVHATIEDLGLLNSTYFIVTFVFLPLLCCYPPHASIVGHPQQVHRCHRRHRRHRCCRPSVFVTTSLVGITAHLYKLNDTSATQPTTIGPITGTTSASTAFPAANSTCTTMTFAFLW